MAAIKTIMTTNNNTERQYNQQDQQNHTGNLHRGLKGILSRSRPNENAPKQQQGPSSTYMARRHHQQEVVDDFLPNPRIPDSPSGTPPKKIWEGAYHKFLSIGKNNSSPVDLQVVPQTDSPTSTTAKKSGFSLLPGSRRLVTRSSYNMPTTPKSVPDMGKTTTEVDPTNVPLMPTLKGRSDSVSDGNLARHGSNGEENAVRGGNFFQAIFKQGGGSRPSSPWGGKKNSNASISHDELDAPLRKGIEKASSSPDYRSQCMDRKRDLTSHEEGQPATSAIERQSQIEEDESGGLDSLLASASSSPSYITTMNEMGMPTRASSLGRIHYPQQQQQQQQQSQRNGHMPSPSMPSLLIPPMIPPQIITEPPGDDKKHNVAPAQIPQPRQRGCLGSLLSQQVADSELDTQHHHHLNNDQQQHQKQPQDAQLNGVVAPSSHPQHYQQPPQQEMPAGSNLDSILSDPSFEVQLGASPSLFQNVQYHNHHQQQQFLHQHQQQNGVVNPEMKKAFTEFHNASRFAQDATSAFLGDDMSSSFRHDSYVSYHAMMMRGGGSSVPYHAFSERDIPAPVNVSTSLPLEPVDEGNISIHKGMRLLKPIEATDSWQQGRRYLVAPAALAACPLAVVNKLSGNFIQTAKEADTSENQQSFGTIDLGEALITCVGEKHHLSLGKWSSCHLVLRQKYLLEYDCSSPITGLPRGYAHLEHAVAYKHNDFQDAFKLQFYASPCAKSDQRVLMVRVKNREDRDHWVNCLNDAAKLRVDDLWEFDPDFEFGRGRYAAVYPARRKNSDYFAKQQQNPSKIGDGQPDRSELLKRCDCALKVVDKNQFWRRVVKGRERADTLVREQAVQSTLTSKCGRVPTFLKLRGFFETSDQIVMELELLEGTDLFEYISSKGVLDEDEAALVIRDVLTSLEAMNRVGLAHRDIKPANVLMCCREKDGVSAKVGDFGMSTFVGVDGLIRGRCGTPGYVAPEILSAGCRAGYGNKVDVFSAGVTLYVMLCGYEPFYGESDKELVEANKQARIDFPESDWGKVSKEARDLVLKMTKADPTDRISAKEALQHPWITAMREGGGVSFPNVRNMSLETSDAREEGVCVIS